MKNVGHLATGKRSNCLNGTLFFKKDDKTEYVEGDSFEFRYIRRRNRKDIYILFSNKRSPTYTYHIVNLEPLQISAQNYNYILAVIKYVHQLRMALSNKINDV